MLNKELNLSDKIFEEDIEKAATRDGYGEGVVIAGEQDSNVVVLCADLTESTRSEEFKNKFPDRFFEVGVAEQNMVTVASGMANYGKIPFAASYAVFSPGRNWEQIRTTICINDVAVKIVGSHAGVTVGEDGATHQALEDIALMRALPNMIVISPADSVQAKKATVEMAKNGKPSYIRLGRNKTPIMTTDETPFEIGKAQIMWEESDPQVAIIATGPLVYESLLAAHELKKVEVPTVVVNMHTIKPIDTDVLIKLARTAEAFVTVEEHQISGGLGSSVAEVLSQNYPRPIEMIGVKDRFGQSGTPEQLLKEYELGWPFIVEAAKTAIARKIDNRLV